MDYKVGDIVSLTYRERQSLFRLDEFDGRLWKGEMVGGDYMGDKVSIAPTNFDDASGLAQVELNQLQTNPYQAAAEAVSRAAMQALEMNGPVVIAEQAPVSKLTRKEKLAIARQVLAHGDNEDAAGDAK